MQALLLLPQPRFAAAFSPPPLPHRVRKTLTLIPSSSSTSASTTTTTTTIALSHFPPSPSPCPPPPPPLLILKPLPHPLLAVITPRNRNRNRNWNWTPPHAAAASSPTANDESERAKLAQVSKRLENTSRYFKRLGSLGFWGQLVCTVVSAVILSFSTLVTGKVTSPITFYTTAGGIAAAFVSVFWSFGYIRLSERLKRTANEPAKAPPRADVVKSLKNGIAVNLLGMGAAVLGMQATVGLLVAKALTASAVPYYQGIPPGRSPVLALDVFLIQASANTILSHFLGLVCSLELLRSVTLPAPEAVPIPKAV